MMYKQIGLAAAAGAATYGLSRRGGRRVTWRQKRERSQEIQAKYPHLKGHLPRVRYTYFDGHIVYLFGADGTFLGWGNLRDKASAPNTKVIDGLGVVEFGSDFTPRVNMAKLRLIGRAARGRRASSADRPLVSFTTEDYSFAEFKRSINTFRKNRGWYEWTGWVDHKNVRLKGYDKWLQIYQVDGVDYSTHSGIDTVREFNEALAEPFKKGSSARGRRASSRRGTFNYEVIVGNIGTVYSGGDEREARRIYEEYKRQSESNYGRAGGEDVTYMDDGEPILEHFGQDDWKDDYEGEVLSQPMWWLGRSARGRRAKTKSRFAGMDLTAADFRPRTREGFYKRGKDIIYIYQPQPYRTRPGSRPLGPGDWWVDYVGTLTDVDKSGPTNDGVYQTSAASGGMKLYEFKSGGWRRMAPSKLNANWRAFFKRAGINPSKVK